MASDTQIETGKDRPADGPHVALLAQLCGFELCVNRQIGPSPLGIFKECLDEHTMYQEIKFSDCIISI